MLERKTRTDTEPRADAKTRTDSKIPGGSLQEIDGSGKDPIKTEAPRRPLRDALKNILGGSSSGR
jgi:hypothetical protein